MTAAATLAQLASSGALTADTSGNVSIGTTSTVGKFRVSSSDSSVIALVNGSSYGVRIGSQAGIGGYIEGVDSGGVSTYQPLIVGGSILQFTTSGSERVRIDTNGNLLVGTGATYNTNTRLYVSNTVDGTLANPQCVVSGAASTYSIIMWLDGTAAYIGQNSNARALRMFSGSAGTSGVNLAVGGTSWGTFSDERIKTNLVPIENAIEKVSTLRTVTGRYTTDDESTSRVFLIAQDVQAVLPEAVDVGTDEDKTLFLKYTETIPLLVAAIKELKAELDVCKAEIAALKGV